MVSLLAALVYDWIFITYNGCLLYNYYPYIIREMRLKIPESYRLEPEIRNYFNIERILSQAVICLRAHGYVMLVFFFSGEELKQNWW